MSFAGGFVNVRTRFGNPVVLLISPLTAYCITMNASDVIMRSNDGGGKSFQYDTESSRRDIETAGLEPDTVRVRNPQMFVVEIRVGDEVFAASLVWLKAIGKSC
jgi:hypothetical protein